MADILKISTPYLDKSAVPSHRPIQDVSLPFEISETQKVIQTHNQNQMESNTNQLLMGQNSPSTLTSLLRDPSVAVNFLKNIYLLQEFISLIPGHNSTVTNEIQEMFDALLVNPDEIVAELLRQECTSTSYKGELFDFLRNLLNTNTQKETKAAISAFLKSLNGLVDKQEITQSLSNNLEFLANNLKGSASLNSKLAMLAQKFAQNDAATHFSSLKAETLELLNEVESSILFTPKLQRAIPLIIYNLSRFSDNPDFLQDSIGYLMTLLNGSEQRGLFMKLLKEHLEEVFNTAKDKSQVLDTLSNILGKQVTNEDLTLANSERLEKIIHSLLSSPCNFTPLLHFIVPVYDGNTKAFAEMWIDPNSEEESPKDMGKSKDNMHILIEFDVEGIGQFESEIFVVGKKINLKLFCPYQHVKEFMVLEKSLKNAIEQTGYTFTDIKVSDMQKQRSLMQVFKTLPHKRTGINVKI